MDHFKILRRSFHITFDYKALWVFGILLALTTAGRGGGSGGGGGGGGGNGSGAFPTPGGIQTPIIPGAIVTVLLMIACVIFLLIIAALIVRYLSETSLIRMVDIYETTEEKVGVRAGFRLGWSRGAFRIFLIDLIFGLGGFFAFLLLMLVAALPLLAWLTDSQPLQGIGTAIAIGLALLFILVFIVVVIVISLLVQFMRRAAILEDRGVVEAIRRGYRIVRQRPGDAIIMGVILFAIGLAWIFVMFPLVLILVILGLLLGGLPGVLIGGLASLFLEGAAPWIIGAVIGFPIFLLVIIVPTSFLNGLYRTYITTAWTLTYREMVALETGQIEKAPE